MRRSTEAARGSNKELLSDAISRIFSERASFELRDDDVEALRMQLKNGHFGNSKGRPESPQKQAEMQEAALWKAKHPCLLKSLPQLFGTAKNKRVTIFMDYDGTLTPIVKDPDRAFMSDQMREVVKAVASLFPTAIISGRGREKVMGFVKLQELFYAGSHGMDIVGPVLPGSNGNRLSYQAAAKFAPIMDRIFDDLVQRTKSIPGAAIEHNKFCVSVHFRNCEADRLEDVLQAVEAVLAKNKELKATRGRKVLEIRPQVEWNKGHALNHLLDSLQLDDMADVMPIYIGDDRTDEDAFAVLNQRPNGVGILVSSKVKPTAAVYRVRDPLEVMSFLTSLVDWGKSRENAWHEAKSCSGWRLNPDSPSLPASLPGGPLPTAPTYSSDTSGIGEEDASYPGWKHSGRPPLCRPERSRPINPAGLDSTAQSHLAEKLRVFGPTTQAGTTHAELGNGILRRGGEQDVQLPASTVTSSPFDGVPAWTHSVVDPSEREPSTASQSDDSASVMAVQGSISSQATDKSLRRIILEVADNVKEASSPMVEPPQAIDLQGLQEQHL